MGLDTQLFEIDPSSSLFELLRSDEELAQNLLLLAFRYDDRDYFEEERGIADEYGGVIEAIDRMVDDEPDFENRWIDLPNHHDGLSGPLSVVAEKDGRTSLVEAIFRGERELTPGRDYPACWIDSDRCREIAGWLDTITAPEIGDAAIEHYERTYGRSGSGADDMERVRTFQHGKVREFHRLFAGAADRENVVVVLVQ